MSIIAIYLMPPESTSKLPENPSALRREHPALENMKFLNLLWVIFARVSDPHWFNADTDPDPAFFLIADPDPGYGSRVWWPKIEKKIMAGKFNFYFLYQNLKFTYP
jgi:hypothetical protein